MENNTTTPIQDLLATPEYAAVKVMIEVLYETEITRDGWVHLNAIKTGMDGLA